MTWIETIIISIVEGLTEFLPVSSTGHMIITQNLLGIPQGDPFVHAFTFIIQFGAILSVVCLYWKRFFQFDNSPAPAGSNVFQKLKHRYYFYWLLIVGVVPAVVVGLAAKKSGLLDWLLDSVEVVAVMLVVGGIFMLYCDKLFNKGSDVNKVNESRAFRIGLYQYISVIPGVSRSMATIVGGMTQGLTRKKAGRCYAAGPAGPAEGGSLVGYGSQHHHARSGLRGVVRRGAAGHEVVRGFPDEIRLQGLWLLPHHCRRHHHPAAVDWTLTRNG